jgi:hypothetical protein
VNVRSTHAAFRKHGLAADNVAYVGIGWSGSAPGDVADNEDLDVSVLVDDGSLTLATTNPVMLRYRINRDEGAGGAWTAVAMTLRVQGDYHYAIPSSNFQIGDVVDFYIRAEVTNTSKQFTCFPTQAQFDWTAPNGDNIPEERDFFSVLVTNSSRIEPISTDLRTDPGWTVGVDEWEFGAPDLAEWGQQPGNDYPFDDDLGLGGGPTLPNCYFTSNAGSVDGSWELTTSPFDLTDQRGTDYAVVGYALWFFARQATVGQDKFEVELLGSDNNWYPIQTIDVEPAPGEDDDTKLVRWVRQRLTVQHGTGQDQVPFGSQMKLRFRAAESITRPATVEAVVDEVRVWGVFD